MPKVSVIIPVYNVEKYLKRCLDSVINQTLTDIEMICVNDGSTDSSAEILNEYAKKDDRIKIINQVNSGLSEARNVGVREATGEFIGYLDSDDFIEKDYYGTLYNAAKANGADIACASIIRENNKQKKILIEYKEEQSAETVKEKFELAHIPEHCYVWNKIYNREKLIKSGVEFVRGLMYEDAVYSPDVIEALGKLTVVPRIYHHYWNNSGSIIKSPSDKCRADKLYGHKLLIEKCRKYNVKLRLRDELVCKREYFLLGVKVLKVYQYRATKVYSLFGLLPIMKCTERV